MYKVRGKNFGRKRNEKFLERSPKCFWMSNKTRLSK